MPFPFKKKSADEPGMPESPEMPMRKQPAMAKASTPKPAMEPTAEPEETPTGEVSGHAAKIVAEGEKYGLSPQESKSFAGFVLQACMEGMGGEDEAAEVG